MSTLNVSLILTVVDRLTQPVRRITSQVNQLGEEARRSGAQLRQALRQEGMNRLRTGLTGIARELVALTKKTVLLGSVLAGAFGLWFVRWLGIGAKFKEMEDQLTEVEGSAIKGQQAMMRLLKFVERSPLTIGAASAAYASLKSNGIDPLNGSLQALSDAAAKYNIDQEDMADIAERLGTAFQRNKLEMKDVNALQNKGIDVIQLLAGAMGKSDAKIETLIKKGLLGRRTLALLFEAMGKDAQGAAEQSTKSLDKISERLGKKWDAVMYRVMNRSGVLDLVTKKLGDLIDYLDYLLNTPEGNKVIDNFAKLLRKNIEEIFTAAEEAWLGIERLAAQVGGFGNLAQIVLGAVAAIMLGPLLSAIMMTVAGFGLLAAAVLANPILLLLGLVIADIVAIAWKWDSLVASFKADLEQIANWFQTKWINTIEGGKEMIDDLVGSVLALGRALKNLVTFRNPFAGGDKLFPSVEEMQAKFNPVKTRAFEELMGRAPNAPSLLSLGPAAPTLKGLAAQKAEVGGKVEIEIKGPGKVTAIKSDNAKVPLKVSTGLTMAGAY